MTDAGKRKSKDGAGADGGELGARIAERLDALAACTDEPGRITRLYLSPAHRKAADLVSCWMREAGMSVRLDPLANVVGRYEGAAAGAPALLIGSHIDSVPDAGKLDGNLGVVTAIEVVAHLSTAGRRLPFAIEVVAFGDEEGTRFPSTLGGSRLLAGTFDKAMLDERDAGGVSRRSALAAFGCDVAGIAAGSRKPGDAVGYVEVHIEQGPVLEAKGLALGVVTAINGATRGTVEVRGEAGHAGTVPMVLRRDALCAAAEMTLAVERRASAEDGLVATVGRIDIPSGAVNSVPGLARFTLDVRSPSDAMRRKAVDDIVQDCRAIAARRGVAAAIELVYQASAAPCDMRLSELMADVVRGCGIEPFRLPSGAGHDAMAFREVLPIAMLFVRCRGGVSHSPQEHADVADIDLAARVLAAFVERLAAS